LNRPRVLLADDHLLMREKVTWLLESESEFDIIGAVTDADALLDETAVLDPDIVALGATTWPRSHARRLRHHRGGSLRPDKGRNK